MHESCTSEAMLDGIEGDASLLTRPTTATRAHDKAIDIKVDPLEGSAAIRPRNPEALFAMPHGTAVRSLCWLLDAEIKSSHNVAAA